MDYIDWSLIISDADLTKLYQTMSLSKLEQKLGVSSKTISKKLKSLGVVMRLPWNKRGQRQEQQYKKDVEPNLDPYVD